MIQGVSLNRRTSSPGRVGAGPRDENPGMRAEQAGFGLSLTFILNSPRTNQVKEMT